MFIGVTSNAHWERFCKEFGLAEMLADDNLSSNDKRVTSQPWMLPKLREAMVKYSSDELQAKLEKASVPYAPVRRPDQLLTDPHLVATEQLLAVPMEGGQIGQLPKLPFRSSAYEFTLRMPPPNLGENTREVLAEAGFAAGEIDALIADKVVVQGDRHE